MQYKIFSDPVSFANWEWQIHVFDGLDRFVSSVQRMVKTAKQISSSGLFPKTGYFSTLSPVDKKKLLFVLLAQFKFNYADLRTYLNADKGSQAILAALVAFRQSFIDTFACICTDHINQATPSKQVLGKYNSGSRSLTSDYDISVFGDAEAEFVILFDTQFETMFGKHSNTVFDCNVYILGIFMPLELQWFSGEETIAMLFEGIDGETATEYIFKTQRVLATLINKPSTDELAAFRQFRSDWQAQQQFWALATVARQMDSRDHWTAFYDRLPLPKKTSQEEESIWDLVEKYRLRDSVSNIKQSGLNDFSTAKSELSAMLCEEAPDNTRIRASFLAACDAQSRLLFFSEGAHSAQGAFSITLRDQLNNRGVACKTLTRFTKVNHFSSSLQAILENYAFILSLRQNPERFYSEMSKYLGRLSDVMLSLSNQSERGLLMHIQDTASMLLFDKRKGLQAESVLIDSVADDISQLASCSPQSRSGRSTRANTSLSLKDFSAKLSNLKRQTTFFLPSSSDTIPTSDTVITDIELSESTAEDSISPQFLCDLQGVVIAFIEAAMFPSTEV